MSFLCTIPYHLPTMKFAKSMTAAWLLNLLLPGSGHWYWKEYAFGLFVFLITLLTTVLFVASFFVPLPAPVKVLILGLPLVFYAFTFVDLARTVRTKRRSVSRSQRVLLIVLVVAVVYQLCVPIAPLNFALRNRPEIFTLEDNRLSPLFAGGDLLKASRVSYLVNIFALDRPLLHTLPERYDVVRFKDASGGRGTGIVVGLPSENIEIIEGVVVVNGLPDFDTVPDGMFLAGDWPLTRARQFSILVATLKLGSIGRVQDVPLTDLIGKVEKLL